MENKETFEIKLVTGEIYRVECYRQYIDTLLDLIGETNIDYCEDA